MRIKKILKITGIVILLLIIGYFSYFAINVAIGKSKLEGAWRLLQRMRDVFKVLNFEMGTQILDPLHLKK
ncbi:hypothetical protein ACFFF5_10960 [Lederbergia wuyishanensis]|uniref:Uncharacterized protein n=1 Tax=Lederbergia wuyishanensis TaxID=1347903 RepID=A0ABU0D4E3_9BACI|nr:hypothetical protein [Lederbergia wuyishanensis]MCJ8008147.1 hypothetical protein [Lederbergia wuyishanensis]MDQ0343265.1 hypothetical protein [Lederbergia wuyishanensis]